MTDAYSRLLAALRDHGCTVDDKGDHGTASTPGHAPADRGTTFRRTADGVIMFCHNGDREQVLADLGLTMADLFDSPRTTYEYADGRTVTRGYRDGRKTFTQSGVKNGTALFNAENLPTDPDVPIYVVEGEKDVRAAASVGVAAVSQAQGANTPPSKADWSPLTERLVVVVRDDDEPGRRRADAVGRHLRNIAARVLLAEPKVGKDLADHLAAGYPIGDLVHVGVLKQDVAEGASDQEYTGPRVWKATDLDGSRSLEFLAARRVPRASVTYMLGPEGIGKSLWFVWLTALITTGKPFPEFGIPARDPGYVVLVLTEDDWATIARPRLELAGADLDYVRVICSESDGSGTPTFPRHMPIVTEAAQGATLVVVDAWADTLPPGANVKDGERSRQIMHPWKDLATRTGVAVILSGHTNRAKDANVRNVYGLSAALRQKARMTILAQPDPDDSTVMLIGPEKSNVVGNVPASKFRIESVQVFERTEDSDGTVPKLVWIGDSEHSARALFEDAADIEDGEDRDDRTAAKDWLEDYLMEAGAASSVDVKKAAKAAGFSDRTIQRTAKKLGVIFESKGYPRITHWRLPSGGGASDDPVSDSGGATGATGHDQAKRGGATGATGATGGATAGATGGTGSDQAKRADGGGQIHQSRQSRHSNGDTGASVAQPQDAGTLPLGPLATVTPLKPHPDQSADAVQRAKDKIPALLRDCGPMSTRDLRRRLSAETRKGLESALEELATDGKIAGRPEGSKYLYRLTEKGNETA